MVGEKKGGKETQLQMMKILRGHRTPTVLLFGSSVTRFIMRAEVSGARQHKAKENDGKNSRQRIGSRAERGKTQSERCRDGQTLQRAFSGVY